MRNYRVEMKKCPDGKVRRTGSEDDEQEKVFQWKQLQLRAHPELKSLHHTPNGGSRNRLEAVKLKRMGVLAGIPDIELNVSRGGYHGLFIEMKVGMNKPTENQVEMMGELIARGYKCAICWSGDDAIDVIKEYLGI